MYLASFHQFVIKLTMKYPYLIEAMRSVLR